MYGHGIHVSGSLQAMYLSGLEEAAEQAPECFEELHCLVSVAPSAAAPTKSQLYALKHPEAQCLQLSTKTACRA